MDAEGLDEEVHVVLDGGGGGDGEVGLGELFAALLGGGESEGLPGGEEGDARAVGVFDVGEQVAGDDGNTARDGEEPGAGGVGVEGDDGAGGREVAGGVEVAGQERLGGGLGDGAAAEGDVDVGEGAFDEVELVVDAVALELLAVDPDEVIVEVLAEASGACVDGGAVVVDDEEAWAVDGEVAGVAGGCEAAVVEVSADAGGRSGPNSRNVSTSPTRAA